jgi:urea-proton symporter
MSALLVVPSRAQPTCAGRSIKPGLVGSNIVSQWTWAATLLQSSNVAWQYGVSGPFWYAAGATIQVLLFAILAIQVKLRAPRAHTRAFPTTRVRQLAVIW